ncbi:hypothetical protein ABC347_05625 [Sphingomonas sp. 1P06PA]|uniref:hypothetical protein n=1 Tax=Sphingomonas sp. 1P06PA TaxID=554121 RepID=UPI0039A4AD83
MRDFTSFACIDWSGQAVARPKGLAVAICETGSNAPELIRPDGGWSRGHILDWLRQQAAAGANLLVGLDLSPALPYADRTAYFPGWPSSPADARALWAMVNSAGNEASDLLCSTGFLARPEARRHFRLHREQGDAYPPGRGRLRRCEEGQAAMGLSPYSCFNLVGAAQVGKSSLTGMRVLHRLAGQVPVWPFDPVPAQGPVIVEIYTALAARAAGMPRGRSKIRDGSTLDTALAALGSDAHVPLARYDDHSTDAILTAAWLRHAAADASLWSPAGLTPEIARTEGWTFGVT